MLDGAQCRVAAVAAVCSCACTLLVLVLAPHLATMAARNECDQLEKRLMLHVDRHCSVRQRRSAADKVEDNQVGSHVEFFNPKVRGELQAKGELAPGGDSWVWLTSYCRIPYQVVQGFCKATQEYCPPGAAGPPGVKGSRGEVGERGPPGMKGGQGPVGPPGPKGDQGWTGLPGLDGRDGIPGEPGLDGVPGRSGADGIPGNPGKNGINGADGRNGTDGRPGTVGPHGPPGPTGPTGLAGPRGKQGRPGTNGSPGMPGISAWTAYNQTSNELLIPPSVFGKNDEIMRVQEGESIKLRCSATGKPPPEIAWSVGTSSGGALVRGIWKESIVNKSVLEIPKVSRLQAGLYICMANNGVPPQDNRTIYLEVHFPPLIRIRNQMLHARNGSSVHLECEVEAYPEPLRYWERFDGRLIENHDRGAQPDIMSTNSPYRSIMRLTLTRLTTFDFGQYYCIAKNELGLTKGVFTIYEQDPLLGTPPPLDINLGLNGYGEWGQRAPPLVTLEELCPATPTCPTCPKCTDPVISLADLVDHLTVKKLNAPGINFPGNSKRTTDCVLYAIGKPVFHRSTDEQVFGSWLRDSSSSAEPSGDKVWVTREADTKHLFEFSNKSAFKKDQPTKIYSLHRDYVGNGHVVYNGSFYYHSGGRRVARLDLNVGKVVKEVELPSAAIPLLHPTNSTTPAPPSDNSSPAALYSTGHTYMDFSVDDNGLWIIYSMENSNNTAVAKIDPETLQPSYIWNMSINHHKVGEMFIACGVLYAVDSATERSTKVRLAFDLYRSHLLDVSLQFTNPFRRTTALGYSHRHKELYSWDRGNQLTYPVRYHEIGYNTTTESTSLV